MVKSMIRKCIPEPVLGRYHFVLAKLAAVAAIVREAKKGDIVLLSPGAASFGLFKNEFDRGEQFIRVVMAIQL